MLTMRRKSDIWIPTAKEMDNCRKTIAGLVMQKLPWVSPIDAHGDLSYIAFNEGYEVYMKKAPTMKIDRPENWVVEAGYKRGLTYAVKELNKGKREQTLPHTAPVTDEGRQEQSMETALSSELGEIEKSNPASRTFRKERASVLLEAIRALTPKQRKAFLDVHVGGTKLEDAAKNQGVSLRVFERCLDTATAKLAWRVSLTSSEAMCDSYQGMVLALSTPMEPSKDEHKILRQHVIGCQTCRNAVYNSPMVIDVGALLATGAFTAKAGPSLGDRIASSPLVEGPIHVARSIGNRITPGGGSGGGGGHAAETAAGATGAGAGGAGGTALLLGGGKAALAICAAGATATVCVVGAATGVIPITRAGTDHKSDSDSPAIERVVPTAAATTAAAAVEATQVANEAKAAKVAKQQKVAKQKAQKKKAAQRAAAREQQSASSDPQQLSYTSPTTASEPTTQSATNAASADSSMGISTAPPPAPAPTPQPSAQTKTNQSSADASMGCC